MLTIYRKILFILISLLVTQAANAQVEPTALDRSAILNLYGGLSRPGSELSSSFGQLLYAKNGGNFGIEGNYIIGYGIGAGVDFGVDWFGMDQKAFLAGSNAEAYAIEGNYSASYGGLNLSYNLPILISNGFWINIFAMGSGGIRGMRIPEIDLYYDELQNKNVEVSYRARQSTMGYLAYRGGLQFVINEKWGFTASYKRIHRSQHRVNYSVRMFDAEGNLTEAENYLSSYLDSDSFQFGVFLRIGD